MVKKNTMIGIAVLVLIVAAVVIIVLSQNNFPGLSKEIVVYGCLESLEGTTCELLPVDELSAGTFCPNTDSVGCAQLIAENDNCEFVETVGHIDFDAAFTMIC